MLKLQKWYFSRGSGARCEDPKLDDLVRGEGGHRASDSGVGEPKRVVVHAQGRKPLPSPVFDQG